VNIRLVILFFLTITSLGRAINPPEPTEEEKAQFGLGIQRTMRLLSSSTAENRNPVRILFYGQSIIKQDWWKSVAADLRFRFPHADLKIENRAISGFDSTWIAKTAEHDVYPFYPDLIIIHVYGEPESYELLLKHIRGRTTAEVLLLNDFPKRHPAGPVSKSVDREAWWDHEMNTVHLPKLAQKYSCGLLDVRTPWGRYLDQTGLKASDMLTDGVHPNEMGEELLATFLKRYLIVRSEGESPLSQGMVNIHKNPSWDGKTLRLEFTGNRVDMKIGALPKGGKLIAQIDDKEPVSCPGCFAATRPQPEPWNGPISLARVDFAGPPVAEDWTLTITSVESNGKHFKFKIEGSVTGKDGEGWSGKDFTSGSQRVFIGSESWFRNEKAGAIQVGTKITWSVVSLARDVIENTSEKPSWITIAQGLPVGPHVLTLTYEGEGTPPVIEEIWGFQPPIELKPDVPWWPLAVAAAAFFLLVAAIYVRIQVRKVNAEKLRKSMATS
jgi:hypothetical protein